MQMAPSQMVCFQRRPEEKEGFKQRQGLVAWGSCGESHFPFPSRCPTAFPLPLRVVSHAIICKVFTEQVLCARCLGEGAEQARQSPPSWS